MTPDKAQKRIEQMEKMALLPALAAAAPWLLKNIGGTIAANFAADKVGGALGLTGNKPEAPSAEGVPGTTPRLNIGNPSAAVQHSAWAKPASQLAFNAGFELFCKEAGLDFEDTKAMLALARAVDTGHVKVSFDPANPWAGDAPAAPTKPGGMINQFMNFLSPNKPQADNPNMPGYDPGYIERQDPNPYRRTLKSVAGGAWKGLNVLANPLGEAARLLGPEGDEQTVSPARMLERYNATHGEQAAATKQRGAYASRLTFDDAHERMENYMKNNQIDPAATTPQQLNSIASRIANENVNGIARPTDYDPNGVKNVLMKRWSTEANQSRQGTGMGQFGPPPAPPSAPAAPAPAAPPAPSPVPSWANNSAPPAAGAPAPSSPKPIPEAPKVT